MQRTARRPQSRSGPDAKTAIIVRQSWIDRASRMWPRVTYRRVTKVHGSGGMSAELQLLAFGTPRTPNEPSASVAPISKWNEDERPRERLLRFGPAGLSNAELLAVFLRTGVPGATAIDVANSMLNRVGAARGDAAGRVGALPPGVGRKSPRDAAAQFTGRSRGFFALHDRRARPRSLRRPVSRSRCAKSARRYPRGAQGTTSTRVPVFPQEIVRHALKCNAVGVIVAHHHRRAASSRA